MSTTHTRYVIGRLSMLIATAAAVMVWCVVTLVATPAARASTGIIVSDDFSGTNGDPINGRTPNTIPNIDLPGGSWYSVNTDGITVATNNNPFGAAPVISGNTALMTINSSAFISIQSAGSYVKPTLFAISADIKVGTVTGIPAGSSLGVGLGFNDIKSAFDVSQEISLGANGDVNLAQVLIAPYNAADFGGHAFDPTTFYHLEYTVNTATGGVSDLSLSNGFGSENYSVSTAAFTDAKTAYAGIFSNSFGAGVGNIDNFVVVAPEPASMALLAGGALLLLRRRK